MPGTETILCVGAAHWDVIGRAEAPLAPGADVPGHVLRRPGGVAANVARFLAGLGQPAALAAVIGADAEGAALVATLEAAGVDCARMMRAGTRTDVYLAIEAADGGLHAAVADCRGLESVGADLAASAAAAGGPLVVDGNLPETALARIAKTRTVGEIALLAASPDKAARLGAAAGPRARFYGNRTEAEALCGRPFRDSAAAVGALVARGFAGALVSDGAGNAAVAAPDGIVQRAPPRVDVRSVTGAGDMLAAAHLAALARGLGPGDALAFALAAAARHISGDTA
jgi:sugar/nucleoside kinase (ribokinase family)